MGFTLFGANPRFRGSFLFPTTLTWFVVVSGTPEVSAAFAVLILLA